MNECVYDFSLFTNERGPSPGEVFNLGSRSCDNGIVNVVVLYPHGEES